MRDLRPLGPVFSPLRLEPPLSPSNILIVCAFALALYANIQAEGKSAVAWAVTLLSVALLLPLVS